MNYNNHHAVFTRKVAGYDFYTCRRALMDCHDTLKIWGQDIAEDYAVKLWAEIDALRERQLKLSKVAA
jgi:hypothetical protein